MIHVLFKSILLNLHVFGDFSSYLLLLNSGVISLWCQGRHCMISILFNLLRHILSPIMWSILVNIPSKLKKNVNCAFVGWSSLWMSITSVNFWCSWVQLCSSCLLDLSISNRRVLKSSTMRVDLSSFPCSYNRFCLTEFDSLLLVSPTLKIVMTCWRIEPSVIM